MTCVVEVGLKENTSKCAIPLRGLFFPETSETETAGGSTWTLQQPLFTWQGHWEEVWCTKFDPTFSQHLATHRCTGPHPTSGDHLSLASHPLTLIKHKQLLVFY